LSKRSDEDQTGSVPISVAHPLRRLRLGSKPRTPIGFRKEAKADAVAAETSRNQPGSSNLRGHSTEAAGTSRYQDDGTTLRTSNIVGISTRITPRISNKTGKSTSSQSIVDGRTSDQYRGGGAPDKARHGSTRPASLESPGSPRSHRNQDEAATVDRLPLESKNWNAERTIDSPPSTTKARFQKNASTTTATSSTVPVVGSDRNAMLDKGRIKDGTASVRSIDPQGSSVTRAEAESRTDHRDSHASDAPQVAGTASVPKRRRSILTTRQLSVSVSSGNNVGRDHERSGECSPSKRKKTNTTAHQLEQPIVPSITSVVDQNNSRIN